MRKLFNLVRNKCNVGEWEQFCKVQRIYKKAKVVAKINIWKQFCESIEAIPEAFRLQRILSKENNPHMGCLKLPSGDYTGSVEKSLGYIMEVHFPGSRGPFSGSARQPELGGDYKPREQRLAAKVVYPSGVEWVIKFFKHYKTPGIDGLYPSLLQEGLRCLLQSFTEVFRASIPL